MVRKESQRWNRRTVLKITGASIAGLTSAGAVSAQSDSSSTPNSDSHNSSKNIDTGFDPNNNSEVRDFVIELAEFDNEEQRSIIENDLNQEQQGAVIEAMKPAETEMRVLQPEPTVSISSLGFETEKAVYEVVTRGAMGQKLWRFAHRCLWDYNGSVVRSISSTPAGETFYPYWTYQGSNGEKTNRDTYFLATQQGRFTYCPLEIGCVATDEPIIEIRGQADGTHTGNSNYD